MKITFEGKTFRDISEEMESLLTFLMKNIPQDVAEKPNKSAVLTAKAQGPGPEAIDTGEDLFVDKSVDKPVDKMAKVRAAKQAKATKATTSATAAKPAPLPVDELPDEMSNAAPALDPAQIVKIRTQTIEELQSAYANGHQKEVFELLSRFGNGAKSFRELPPEAFVPIREAIDNGALT